MLNEQEALLKKKIYKRPFRAASFMIVATLAYFTYQIADKFADLTAWLERWYKYHADELTKDL